MIFCWAGLVRGAFHLAGHFTASDTRAGGFLFWMLLGGGVCAYDIPLGLQITTPFSVRILGGGGFLLDVTRASRSVRNATEKGTSVPYF